jgi:DNA-binding transcriptional ArsR family regulator
MKQYLLTKQIKDKATLLTLSGEPTRIRILCALFDNPGLCVHEISEAVDSSIALASHHLQTMKEGGLVESERNGQTICYKIIINPSTKKLKQLICEIE